MSMTRQPYGIRRIPRVASKDRPLDPQTGKPVKPMEYNIELPVDGGGWQYLGYVQRVPQGTRTSRDFWRPWPVGLKDNEILDALEDDAAYIRALEFLVDAWRDGGGAAPPKPEAPPEVPAPPSIPSGASPAATTTSAEATAGLPAGEHEHGENGPAGCVRCDLARQFNLEAAALAEARAAEASAALPPDGEAVPVARTEDDLPGMRERADFEGGETDSDVQPDPYIDTLAAAHASEYEPALAEDSEPAVVVVYPDAESLEAVADELLALGAEPEVLSSSEPPVPVAWSDPDLMGTAEPDAIWAEGPLLPPEVPAPQPEPVVQFAPPRALADDLAWMAAPAQPAQVPAEEPAGDDPFSDPRLTPFA